MTTETDYKEGVHYDVDDSEVKEYKLPPQPQPFYKWEEKDQRYKGDMDDLPSRIKAKLYKTWILWANLRTCTELEEILAKKVDFDTDQYKVNSVLVRVMDTLAKILSDTDLLQELSFLCEDKKEEE